MKKNKTVISFHLIYSLWTGENVTRFLKELNTSQYGWKIRGQIFHDLKFCNYNEKVAFFVSGITPFTLCLMKKCRHRNMTNMSAVETRDQGRTLFKPMPHPKPQKFHRKSWKPSKIKKSHKSPNKWLKLTKNWRVLENLTDFLNVQTSCKSFCRTWKSFENLEEPEKAMKISKNLKKLWKSWKPEKALKISTKPRGVCASLFWKGLRHFLKK